MDKYPKMFLLLQDLLLAQAHLPLFAIQLDNYLPMLEAQ